MSRGQGRSFPKTAIWTFIILLSITLVGEIIWGYWIGPSLAIRHISLASDLGLSDDQLLEMLDIGNESWASFNEEKIQARLESYPVIRRAKVIKVFPDKVKLFLYRRKPVALALTDSENGPVMAVFDKQGYIVQVGGLSNDLPVISGQQFPAPVLGARLPNILHGILANLSRVQEDEPKLFALISEIEIVPHGNDGYDLRVYMNHASIPVLVNRFLSAEVLRRVVLVIDVLSSGLAGRAVEADMRSSQVVYRLAKES